MNCREWRGARTNGGYGKRKIKGRMVLVHRWVWEQINGPIPPDVNVLHRCDNPPCYRYDHLFTGTQADNLADMRSKGRYRKPSVRGINKGEANGNTLLTTAQVSEIRQAIATGEVQRRIAERYGVAPSTVTRIKQGQVW